MKTLDDWRSTLTDISSFLTLILKTMKPRQTSVEAWTWCPRNKVDTLRLKSRDPVFRPALSPVSATLAHLSPINVNISEMKPVPVGPCERIKVSRQLEVERSGPGSGQDTGPKIAVSICKHKNTSVASGTFPRVSLGAFVFPLARLP